LQRFTIGIIAEILASAAARRTRRKAGIAAAAQRWIIQSNAIERSLDKIARTCGI